MRPLKLEILQFSKSISCGIFNVSWQMTLILKLSENIGPDFRYLSLVFVSRDYELGTKFRLIVVYLLRKNMEIEVSALATFRQIQEVRTVIRST